MRFKNMHDKIYKLVQYNGLTADEINEEIDRLSTLRNDIAEGKYSKNAKNYIVLIDNRIASLQYELNCGNYHSQNFEK